MASEVRLVPARTTYSRVDGNRATPVAVHFLDYVVDGGSLRELSRDAGHPAADLVTGLCRAWPAAVAATVQDLLGGAGGHSPDVEMLVCQVCGDRSCGALLADVTVSDGQVMWHHWRFASADGQVAVTGLAAYSFDRRAYEAEVRAAPATVAGLPDDEDHGRRRVRWPWQWGWRMP